MVVAALLAFVTRLMPAVLTVAAFNCATFTASVSSVPAATPMIWRVTDFSSSVLSIWPIAIAFAVDLHAEPVFVVPVSSPK